MKKSSGAALLIGAVLLTSCRQQERKSGEVAASPGAPVIIISIDTLRADHLPAYGYGGVQTPNIDALRADSILYQNAYAQVPLTLPSHVSLLTGKLPADHKVRNNIGYSLDPATPTIASALKARGYETGAAVSAVVLRGTTGLAKVFDFYDDRVAVRGGVAAGSLQRNGAETVAVAESWVGQRKERPFFFLLHLFEPHSPYQPTAAHQQYALPYDGEIATADEYVGRFLTHLKSQGIYDRAMIILLSDHGEGLNDHGEEEHGILLYREALHVPLMVKLPGGKRKGEKVDTPVQLLDVFPTVMQIAGGEPPEGLKGVSLLSAEIAPRQIFSETMYPRIHLGWSDLRSLINDTHHFIDAPTPELYDVKSDPAEKNNVLSSQRRVYARLREEIQQYDRTLNLPSQVDPETAKQLTALGYLGGSGAPAAGELPDPKDRIGDIALMRSAANAAAAGRLDEAIRGFQAILAKSPGFIDARSELAKNLEEAGRHEEAAAAFRKNIEMAPSLASELGLSLGFVYLNMRKFDEAEQHARLALEANPPAAYMLLGRVALAKKDYASAMQDALKAAEYPSYRKDALVLQAECLTAGRRFDEALRALDAAESLADGTPVPLLEFARGDALARIDRIPEAEAAFQREIRNFPSDHHAYASLTVLYLLQEREREAVALMQTMVKRTPTGDAYALATRTFEELGRPALARQFRR